MTATKTLEERISEEAQDVCEDLTKVLREKAHAAKWPAGIANLLEVKYIDESFSIDYPQGLQEAIDDLEYGTPKTPPLPVIRPFMDIHMAEGQAALENALISIMYSDGYL